MSDDGRLRPMFRERFPKWQWTPIENAVAWGTPDAAYLAPGGVGGWAEFKFTDTLRVTFRPFQPAWLAKHVELGGRATIAIRRRPRARKFSGVDELWLADGAVAFRLRDEELSPELALCVGARGPRSWDWAVVGQILLRTTNLSESACSPEILAPAAK
jgi:hypothetical protein